MHTTASHATSRATSATKPRRHPTHPTAAAHAAMAARALMSPEQTEGVIIRAAGCLSQDLANHPSARTCHLSNISGMLGLAVALGILTDDRAVEIRRATVELFDGAVQGGNSRRHVADPTFAAIVAAVRRHKGASLNEPLAMAELSPGDAAQFLGRLISARIVGQADASGFHPAIEGGNA